MALIFFSPAFPNLFFLFAYLAIRFRLADLGRGEEPLRKFLRHKLRGGEKLEKVWNKPKSLRNGPFRMAVSQCVERPRYKGTLGSLLAWRTASLHLVRLLFCIKPHMRDDGKAAERA